MYVYMYVYIYIYIYVYVGSELPASASRFVLSDPYLVHWFAAQADMDNNN